METENKNIEQTKQAEETEVLAETLACDLSDAESWRGKAYSFINHRECECFPCHPVKDEENFNCLFCFCPLYALGENCGGNYAYYDNGVKDCSSCMVPHKKENYGYIMSKFSEIVELTKRK